MEYVIGLLILAVAIAVVAMLGRSIESTEVERQNKNRVSQERHNKELSEQYAADREAAEAEDNMRNEYSRVKEADMKEYSKLCEEVEGMPVKRAVISVTIYPSGVTYEVSEDEVHSTCRPYYNHSPNYGFTIRHIDHSDWTRNGPYPKRIAGPSIETSKPEDVLRMWLEGAKQEIHQTHTIGINDTVHLIEPGGYVEFGGIEMILPEPPS